MRETAESYLEKKPNQPVGFNFRFEKLNMAAYTNFDRGRDWEVEFAPTVKWDFRSDSATYEFWARVRKVSDTKVHRGIWAQYPSWGVRSLVALLYPELKGFDSKLSEEELRELETLPIRFED